MTRAANDHEAMEKLSAKQGELIEEWLPGAEVTTDHSWGLVGTTVLQLSQDGERYIAKTGDANDTHIAREIRAHREWLAPWTSINRAPELVHADEMAKLLLTRYLPGQLVQGTSHETEPDIYRQAGELLASFHGQLAIEDDDFETRAKARAFAWLDKPHRIDPDIAARLRKIIRAWPTPPATVGPTHGDWQPRNWLVHNGIVSVIDFGRAALRPPLTDFARLAVQQFRHSPKLEEAFLAGYGSDPRDPDAWQRNRIREAIGTTAWAYQFGDEQFERQGLRMIAEALADE